MQSNSNLELIFSFLPSEYWDYRHGLNLVYELLKINTGPHVYQENMLSSEIDQQLPFSKCQFFMCKIRRFIMTFPHIYLFLIFTVPNYLYFPGLFGSLSSVHLKLRPCAHLWFPLLCMCADRVVNIGSHDRTWTERNSRQSSCLQILSAGNMMCSTSTQLHLFAHSYSSNLLPQLSY